MPNRSSVAPFAVFFCASWFIAFSLTTCFLGFARAENYQAVVEAKCTGADPCKACKNCKSCSHCKGSSTCGTCKKNSLELVRPITSEIRTTQT
jgi:hypothetical protein